jgi:Transposase IS116/IS110/IS902 family
MCQVAMLMGGACAKAYGRSPKKCLGLEKGSSPLLATDTSGQRQDGPYCRCVGSQKISNGKRKGSGNTKNGNKYLAWAFVEAANFAIRFSSRIKSFYQKKKSKSNAIVAIKAVAHKLCRACYYIMKDQVSFDITKAFA